jgi:hypothetical protein
LPSYVVVLHVYFFHNEQLIAHWCKMNPPVMLPRQQLPICKRETFGQLLEGYVQFWWRLVA